MRVAARTMPGAHAWTQDPLYQHLRQDPQYQAQVQQGDYEAIHQAQVLQLAHLRFGSPCALLPSKPPTCMQALMIWPCKRAWMHDL